MILSLLLVGIIVAANNAAVAVALGALGGHNRRSRVVIIFGVVEFLVPFVGIGIGRESVNRIAGISEWFPPLLLLLLGILAIRAGLRGRTTDLRLAQALTRWRALVLLALGLSLDNLFVGFSLGLRGQHPLLVAGAISSFSMLFAWTGITVGARTGRRWEGVAQTSAGALLVGLAVALWMRWI